MAKVAEAPTTNEQMTTDQDVATLHQRINTLTKKTEDLDREVVEKLNALHVDVKVIIETCKHRGETCAVHVEELDRTLRGNGREGVLTRLTTVEQRGIGKEKYAYLIIGALASGLVALVVALAGKVV